MAVDYEQMDKETDEFIKQLNEPPAVPDTVDDPPADAGGQDDDPDSRPVETVKPEASPDSTDTDELDGLSLENAAERIRNAQARMHRATQEAADFRRALSDEQRNTQRLEADLERLRAERLAAPIPAPATDSANTGMATLETLRDDYPQIIGPLIGTLQELRTELDSIKGTVTSRDESDRIERARNAEQSAKQAQQAHFAAIGAAHPDFQRVVSSEEFKGWASRQSRITQILLYGDGVQGSGYRNGGNAAEIIEVLDAYKKSIGASSRRDEARDAAAPTLRKTAKTQPDSNGRPTFTRAQLEKMSDAEYLKLEPEIDAAMAEGRII